MYNVTLRRVRETIVAVEKQLTITDFSVRVGVYTYTRACSVAYPTRNARAPYSIVSGLSVSPHIFRHFLINETIFWGGGNYWKNVCFDLLYKFFFSGTFLYLKRIQQDMSQMHVHLHVKYPQFLPDFNGSWIFSIYQVS
jgi:hypothetical protein